MSTRGLEKCGFTKRDMLAANDEPWMDEGPASPHHNSASRSAGDRVARSPPDRPGIEWRCVGWINSRKARPEPGRQVARAQPGCSGSPRMYLPRQNNSVG